MILPEATQIANRENMNASEYIRRLHESFKSMERTEMVVHHVPRLQSFGVFILHSLANPKSIGSDEAIREILDKRREPEEREV